MLTKEFFSRPTNTKARVLCDSITPQGQRLISLEAEIPRIILAEMNVHNAIVKNCSSTRAISLLNAIQQIEDNSFEPIYLGRKQGGMAADTELTGRNRAAAMYRWKQGQKRAIELAKSFDECELHKQLAGRVLETYQMVKVVLTASDWDNFFNLRIHPTAQPEIIMAAYKIYKAIQASTPMQLKAGEWHLPYIERKRNEETGELCYFTSYEDTTGCWQTYYNLEDAQRISASCCAQTSYRKSDTSLDKADGIFDRLISADVLHASPFEHLATPVQEENCVIKDDHYNIDESVNLLEFPQTWEKGVTHMRRNGQLCSGILAGWISYRHLLDGNTCWDFDFEERMKLFERKD